MVHHSHIFHARYHKQTCLSCHGEVTPTHKATGIACRHVYEKVAKILKDEMPEQLQLYQ